MGKDHTCHVSGLLTYCPYVILIHLETTKEVWYSCTWKIQERKTNILGKIGKQLEK